MLLRIDPVRNGVTLVGTFGVGVVGLEQGDQALGIDRRVDQHDRVVLVVVGSVQGDAMQILAHVKVEHRLEGFKLVAGLFPGQLLLKVFTQLGIVQLVQVQMGPPSCRRGNVVGWKGPRPGGCRQ